MGAEAAEAVVDEVTLLEAALREAMQRKQFVGGGVFAGSPGEASPDIRGQAMREQLRYASAADLGSAGMQGVGRLDSATAAYGAQLKAWIDMQVDARLNIVVPSILDGELVSLQQESAAAARMYQRVEGDLDLVKGAQAKLLAVVEGISEEVSRLKVQGEALAAVESVMLTVEELKQSVALRDSNPAFLDQLSAQDRALADLRGYHDELRGRHDAFLQTHEAGVGGLQANIEEMRRLHDALHGRYERCEAGLSDFHGRHDRYESGMSALQARLAELHDSHSGILERYSKHENGMTSLESAISDMRRLHSSLQESHHSGFAELHRLHSESQDRHRSSGDELSQATNAMLAMKKEVADLVGMVHQHEKRLDTWRAEITAEVTEEMRAIGNLQHSEAQKSRELQSLQQEVKGELEGRMENLRIQLVKAAKQVDVEDCRLEFRELFQELESKHREESGKHLQRLIAELRAETSSAFRSEAAAVAALDEQLWLTDQRLGQRIDELVHSHRDSISVLERRIGNVLQNRLREKSPLKEAESIRHRPYSSQRALEAEKAEGSDEVVRLEKHIHVDSSGHATVTEEGSSGVRFSETADLSTAASSSAAGQGRPLRSRVAAGYARNDDARLDETETRTEETVHIRADGAGRRGEASRLLGGRTLRSGLTEETDIQVESTAGSSRFGVREEVRVEEESELGLGGGSLRPSSDVRGLAARRLLRASGEDSARVDVDVKVEERELGGGRKQIHVEEEITTKEDSPLGGRRLLRGNLR